MYCNLAKRSVAKNGALERDCPPIHVHTTATRTNTHTRTRTRGPTCRALVHQGTKKTINPPARENCTILQRGIDRQVGGAAETKVRGPYGTSHTHIHAYACTAKRPIVRCLASGTYISLNQCLIYKGSSVYHGKTKPKSSSLDQRNIAHTHTHTCARARSHRERNNIGLAS